MAIRLGFYGAGFIARMHTLSLAVCPVEHRVTAVHDPDAERAASFAARYGAAVVAEDELLDLVDAVYVTTWTSEHARLVEKAAARGKAIFCEKPLAVNATIAEAMVAAVEKAGVPNQVGLVLRFLSPFRFVKHLLADPRAGRVLSVVFRDDQYIPIQGQYALRLAQGSGARRARHAARALDPRPRHPPAGCSGRCARLSAVVREVHGLPRIDDVAVAQLDFESGARGDPHLGLARHPRAAAAFAASSSSASGCSSRSRATWSGRCASSSPARPSSAWRARARDALRAKGDDVANPATIFLTAVRDGTRADPDFAAALPAHRLADAVYASADAGGQRISEPEGSR